MATNTAATNMSLREVRGLAQKLWGHCRDSDSLYRILAPDVKCMRNLLEDLEDQYADDDDIPLRVLERLHKCQASLHRLELTLKAYHTSTHKWQVVKPIAVQELKEGVCGATQELRAVFEGNGPVGEEETGGSRQASIGSAAGVPLNSSQTASSTSLPNNKPPAIPARPKRAQHPPCLTPATEPAAKSAGSQEQQASTSTPSSALTAHDSVTGFSCRPAINKTPSEEKQVVAGPTVAAADVQHDWRMFYGDPLSVDIEEASKWITGSWRGSVDETATVEEEEGDAAPDDHAQDAPGILPKSHDVAIGKDGLGITGGDNPERLAQRDMADNESFHTARAPSAATSPGIEQTRSLLEPCEKAQSDSTKSNDESEAEPAKRIKTMPNSESNEIHHAVLEERQLSDQPTATPSTAVVAPHPAEKFDANATEQSQLLATFRAELEKRFDSQSAQEAAPVNDSPVQPGADGDGNSAEEPSRSSIDGLSESACGVRKSLAALDHATKVETECIAPAEDSQGETPTTSTAVVAAQADALEISTPPKRPNPQTADDGTEITALADSKPATSSSATVAPASPPPPTRAPPPPPPRSSCVKKAEYTKKRPPPPPRPMASPSTSPSKSRYRVVNASPPAVHHSDASTDDDLYSSSRPTSPKAVVPCQTQPVPIPEVKVTECETSEERPQSIVMMTSLKPSSTSSARRRASTNGITHVAFCMAPEVDHGARLRSRKSVDETFEIGSLAPLRETPAIMQRSRSVSAPERSPALPAHRPSTPHLSASPKVSIEVEQPTQVLEYYGNPTESLDITPDQYDLDAERIERICQCWNSQLWDSADAYLMGHLESLVETNRLAAARRVRHLLGVCASFRGQWERALEFFLSVLRTPIKSIDELDAGDCAAAYWLGDTYAMMNRRTEALLAYCIAEQHHSSQDAAAASLHQCLTTDQQAVQLGLSKADFKVRWAQEALNGHEAAGDTILHPSIVTQEAAKACLNSKQSRVRKLPSDSYVDGSRASMLFSLDKSSMEFKHYQRMNLSHQSFMAPYLWPMPYDPMFAMENVSRGRLIAYECDLLEVFRTNPEAKVPKNGPLGFGRMDCFTCNDLEWLIINVRECLHTLEMDWSEVANVEGVWFLARYHTMRDKIATTDYFSIAIFQQSLRSGYGVEVCPDGISSARLIKCSYEYKRGVEWKAEKRTREYIKRFLDKAYRQRATVRKDSTARRESIQGKPLLASGPRVLARAHTAAVPVTVPSETPPPIPPRPSTTRPPELRRSTDSRAMT